MTELLSPAELQALRLSLEVAARSVLFSLPLAVLVAWLLTRVRFPGRVLFDAFVHLPLVLPPVAIGYVLLVLFGTRGPIGKWLYESFGIELAFSTAGAATAIVGSPTPPQKPPDGITIVSTFGISSIRITRYVSKFSCSIRPSFTVHSPYIIADSPYANEPSTCASICCGLTA